ncbi:Methylmalonate-semialdehyde dehydrogenase [gamma proteobacterium IMCC1989]|nr:Methylmalonate-semialdehyde dehydrogenase [gamma proteobacterium IMCC1989]
MSDADMDNATNALMGAAFGSSEERCMALSVVIAVGDAADAFIVKMQECMQKLNAGAYDDNDNDFGSLITQQHKEKVINYINEAESKNADIVADGRNASVTEYEEGFFVGATLIDKVTMEMQSYQEEIFGPVLQAVQVDSMEAAMQLINDHEYGNGTCIFTRDGEGAKFSFG